MSKRERTSQTCVSGPQAGRPALTSQGAQGVQSLGRAGLWGPAGPGAGGLTAGGPAPHPRMLVGAPASRGQRGEAQRPGNTQNMPILSTYYR